MSYDAPLSIEEFKEAMPSHVRKHVDAKVMDLINKGVADPEVLAVYRENVVGLTSVMMDGRFKIESYLSAVKFVSHRLLGDKQGVAWMKTFPDRYKQMVARGNSSSDISAVCSRYAASKLVILLMGQTMMPTHILNAPLYQKAINKLADLMMNANSEKVQSDSAAKLVDALAPPVDKKVELSIGLQEDDTIKTLRESTNMLVAQQRKMIQEGHATVRAIAHSKIITEDMVEEGVVVNGQHIS